MNEKSVRSTLTLYEDQEFILEMDLITGEIRKTEKEDGQHGKQQKV